VKVWDAETGALIRTLSGHNDDVISAAYSPDGRRIVSGSLDNTVKVWDAETGALIRTLSGHDGSVNSATYSPDGRRIVSASRNTVKVWDAGD
jgi:WD40 repeat protein